MGENDIASADKDSGATVSSTEKRSIATSDRGRILELSQIAANVVIVVTLFATAWTLIEQSGQARRDATSSRIEAFYSSEISHAQTVLFTIWSLKDLSVFESGLPRRAIDAIVDKTIETSEVGGPAVDAAIVALTNYFDRVEMCLSSRRCDSEEIRSELGTYGQNFFCLYRGRIARYQTRLMSSTLGNGLEKFAIRMGGCGKQ